MALQLTNLSLAYDDRVLLDGINWRVCAGTCCHIRGDNGVGKSTLLKAIAGIHYPHSGEVTWQTTEGVEISPERLYCGHQSGLIVTASVLDNLMYRALLLGIQLDVESTEFKEALMSFELTPYLNSRVEDLSAGWQQRVSLLCCRLFRADVWLLDEPYANLDAKMRQVLNQMIQTFCQRGGIVLLTSHLDIEFGEDFDLTPFSTQVLT